MSSAWNEGWLLAGSMSPESIARARNHGWLCTTRRRWGLGDRGGIPGARGDEGHCEVGFHVRGFSTTGIRGGCVFEKEFEKAEKHFEETVFVRRRAIARVMAVLSEQ